jgi:thiamine biosynthesis lipoprotein
MRLVREREQFCLRAEHEAMACSFGLELWGTDSDHLRAVAEEAAEELDRLEQQLSAYVPTSDVCWLNAVAADGPARVEPELFDLLALAAHLHEETSGAFDITAGPLIRCWGFFQREGSIPEPDALAEARDRVGMQHVCLDADSSTVFFDRPGIEINLGAIGKGYALRRLLELIGRYDVEAALVHSSASTIAVSGVRPNGEPWRVGLVDLQITEQRLGSVALCEGALSTSGQLEQSFIHDGRRLGHILDPRSGQPALGVHCVWVRAGDPAEADALSTALFVLGPEGARQYCEEHPSVAAYLLLGEEKLTPFSSPRMRGVDLGLNPDLEVDSGE